MKTVIDDRALLSFARSRRQPSLKATIIKRCAEYVYLNSKKHLAKIHSTPGPLRDEILKEVLKSRTISTDPSRKKEEKTNLLEAFNLLLNTRTTELNLDHLYALSTKNLNNQSALKFLFKSIAQRAPNVQTLAIRNFEGIFDTAMARLLIAMRKLRCISLDRCVLQWRTLIELCKNLPDLEELQIAQFDSTVKKMQLMRYEKEFKKDLAHLSQLKRLKCGKMCVDARRFLARHMEHLDLDVKGPIGRGIYDPFESSEERTFFCMPISDRIFRSFRPWLDNYPPNITHFRVMCSDFRAGNSSYYPDFANLEVLTLDYLRRPEAVDDMLMKYGGKLRSLRLSGQHYAQLHFRFARIFELCPQLEELDLDDVIMIDDSEPMNNFSELKQLTWNSTYSKDLSNILLAPNLQVVKIGANRLCHLNLYQALLDSAPPTLNNLHTFDINLKCIPAKADFHRICNCFKKMSTLSQKLTDLKLSFRFKGQLFVYNL